MGFVVAVVVVVLLVPKKPVSVMLLSVGFFIVKKNKKTKTIIGMRMKSRSSKREKRKEFVFLEKSYYWLINVSR